MGTLPLKRAPTLAYRTSGVVALLMGAASIAGLFDGRNLYSASQVSGNFGTDVLNLAIGIPLLVGSMWLTRRGSLAGLLCWPGALFYVLYVYMFYVLDAPFNALFAATPISGPFVALVFVIGAISCVLFASFVRGAANDRPLAPFAAKESEG